MFYWSYTRGIRVVLREGEEKQRLLLVEAWTLNTKCPWSKGNQSFTGGMRGQLTLYWCNEKPTTTLLVYKRSNKILRVCKRPTNVLLVVGKANK